MRPGKRVPPSLAAAPIVAALLWAGCFPQPDVTKMKCIPAKGCPVGYVCVVSGSTGHCERPTDGPAVAVDAEGGNVVEPNGVDGARVGDGGDGGLDAGRGDVSIGGVDAGDAVPSDLAAGGNVGTGGTTGVGGRTGGSSGSGGVVATGGSAGRGGAGTVGTGGFSSARGGAVGTGGLPGSGGFVGTGGMPGTGGAGTGGAGTGGAGTGGAGTGGAGTGGAGTGGTPGTGGSGTGGATRPPNWSPGCGKTPSIPSSQYNNGQPISITAASLQRRYILNVPTNYDNGHPYRLVIALHSMDGNDKQQYDWKYYHLLELSNDSTIFVAPNGQINGAPCSGTGVGEPGCGWPNGSGKNLLLIDAVVAQIEESFCVDTNLIFATGWNYGASMAYETACERPLGGPGGYVRAVAAYGGAQMSGSCAPSKPVAYYASHGTNDNVLSYDGGVALAKKYAAVNGCTWATPPQATGSHICTNLAGCTTGYPVQFCSFVGGHTPFPDSGSWTNSWGPAAVWTFLSQFQ